MSILKWFPLFTLILLLSPFISKVSGQSALIRQEQAKLPYCKDSMEVINRLNRIGMLFYQKNIDSCFYYGMKAKMLSGKIQYAKGNADADNVIAASLCMRGLYSESLELYSRALKTYRQLSDTSSIAHTLMNMAVAYEYVTDTAKAKAMLQEAIATASPMKKDSILALLYLNYYIIIPGLSEDSAVYYLDRSQAIAQRYKDDRVLSFNLLTRAHHLIQTNRRTEALPLIQRALYKSRNDSIEYLEIYALWQYGNYYARHNTDSVLKYYLLAHQLIQEKGYANLRIRALGGILEQAELSGHKDSIIRVHRQIMAALGEENENIKKFIGDYIKYDAIQADNRLLEISNSNKQTKIWLLVVLCGISVLLASFIYRQYRITRRLHKTVTEQNNNLQTTLTALEQSQADNTRMMKIVAHDLRNPIGSMTSLAKIMMKDKPDSEDDWMMLDLIKTSGENSIALVNDLLLVHTRTDELKKEAVDMYQLLQYCVELLHFRTEKKMQQIRLKAIDITLQVNREKMWRVVSNLIGNAIKFSPEGSDILVTLEKKPHAVIIAVKDQGIGIPAKMKDRIFDMFTEAKRTGTAGEPSHGLGLAISRQIVEAHGGSIWYENNPDKGTTFFVELPL